MKFRNIIFSQHAFTRMFEREISPEVVKRAMQAGEVIEDYPNDLPYRSILLLHFEDGRALHIVAGVDETESTCHIVTAYFPDSALWNTDFRTRRKK